MTPAAAFQALGQHLAAMPSCPPIVWPNRTTPLPQRPYLVVQTIARSTIDPTIDGAGEHAEGRIAITCVTALDEFTGAADALAQSVKTRFPKALLIDGVRVRASSVMGGYATDTDWRTPVTVDWTT